MWQFQVQEILFVKKFCGVKDRCSLFGFLDYICLDALFYFRKDWCLEKFLDDFDKISVEVERIMFLKEFI